MTEGPSASHNARVTGGGSKRAFRDHEGSALRHPVACHRDNARRTGACPERRVIASAACMLPGLRGAGPALEERAPTPHRLRRSGAPCAPECVAAVRGLGDVFSAAK